MCPIFVIKFSGVSDLQGVKVPDFPLTLLVIVTTVLRYRAACDSLLWGSKAGYPSDSLASCYFLLLTLYFQPPSLHQSRSRPPVVISLLKIRLIPWFHAYLTETTVRWPYCETVTDDSTLCSEKKHPLTFSSISPWVMCRFKQKLQWIYLRNGRFWPCRN